MCNIVKTYIYEQLKKLTTIAWKWLMKVDGTSLFATIMKR